METQTISNKYIDEDALDKVLSELFGNDFQYIVDDEDFIITVPRLLTDDELTEMQRNTKR